MRILLIVSFSFLSVYCFGQENFGTELGKDKEFSMLIKHIEDYTKKGEDLDFKSRTKFLLQKKEILNLQRNLIQRYPRIEGRLNNLVIKNILQGISENSIAGEPEPSPEDELVDCLKMAEVYSAAIGILNPGAIPLALELSTQACLDEYDEKTK